MKNIVRCIKILRFGNDFCIVYPEDAHVPFGEKRSEELIRLVVKIPVAG